MTFASRFAQFPTWNLIAWAIWAGVFGVLEGMGVKSNRFATLTYLSLHTLPKWALAMFLGWLVYHFMLQYAANQ